MANSIKRNRRNSTTLTSCVSDLSKVITWFLRLGILLMARRGLSTLSVRTDRRLGMLGMISSQPTAMTTTSSQFQPLLKYEFLCLRRPLAIILQRASTVKMMVKIRPARFMI